MVDALVSGTSDRKVVEVQVLSSAPKQKTGTKSDLLLGLSG